MRILLNVSLVFGFAVFSAKALSQDSTEIKAIQSLADRWQAAWNSRNAEALTSVLAEEIDFVTVLGPKGWLKGRKQFQEVHARMFTTLFMESVWKNKATHVKFIREDLAIARVLWETTGDRVRHRKHGELREGIFTWVAEKKNGKWLKLKTISTWIS